MGAAQIGYRRGLDHVAIHVERHHARPQRAAVVDDADVVPDAVAEIKVFKAMRNMAGLEN